MVPWRRWTVSFTQMNKMVMQKQKGEGTALFHKLSTQELPKIRFNAWRSKCSSLENNRAAKPSKIYLELGRKSGRKGVFHSYKVKGSRWFSGNQLATSKTHWSWDSQNCSDRGHKNHLLWTIRNSHHFLSLCSTKKYNRTKTNEALDQHWQWRAPTKFKCGIGKDWRNQHDDFLRKHFWAEQSLPTKPQLLLQHSLVVADTAFQRKFSRSLKNFWHTNTHCWSACIGKTKLMRSGKTHLLTWICI